MESSLNGKMWPFSAYGPFKDKANFPNFIEDQSFEEVRYLCYEAKRQNGKVMNATKGYYLSTQGL